MTQRLPDDLQKLVNRELQARENVIWSAQPGLRRFVVQGLAVAAFGAVWTALILLGIWQFIGFWGGGPVVPFDIATLVLGIPFLLIGLGLLSAPYWAIRKARRTAYALTGRRVLIVERTTWSRTVRSCEFAQLGRMVRRENSAGRGDLILQEIFDRGGDGQLYIKEIGLFGLTNVREVEKLIKDTMARAAGTAALPITR
jgi:hypothetical protein